MTMVINGNGSITGLSAGGLPDATVTTAEIVDLNVTPAKLSQKLTSGTAVASTSGTSIDFTSIPSWVKRITVMFNGVSTNGASPFLIQIGAGSITTTGYKSVATWSSGGTVISTSGFALSYSPNAANVYSGQVILSSFGSNSWIETGILGQVDAALYNAVSCGNVALSGALDRVRITTVNGTDTFDAGSINIMYE